MAKFLITRAGQPPREVAIDGERVTIGRHPYNDIVLAHSAVSGEHAAVSLVDGAAVLDDLGSTNGTFVNGQRIERQLLADGDEVAVAKFTLKFVATAPAVPAVPATMSVSSPAIAPAPLLAPSPAPSSASAPAPLPAAQAVATVEVLNGANLGKILTLAKPVTTLGSPGVLVVVIAREGDTYMLRHVDGASIALLNGQPLERGASPLADGDLLELTGTRMVFRLTT